MGSNSDDLAADLQELKIAGVQKLPGLARAYAQASRDLHNTGFYQDPGAPGMAGIAVFRDLIQNCLVRTHQNLMDNANALVVIAQDYAATDEEAARILQQRWDERMSDPKLNPQLPPMPAPKYAADEHYDLNTQVIQVPGPNGPVDVEKTEPVR